METIVMQAISELVTSLLGLLAGAWWIVLAGGAVIIYRMSK